MKKVILVTLQSANIGHRLQNYALQSVLLKFGCEVYTPLYYSPEEDSFKKRLKILIKCLLYRCGIKKYEFNYITQRRRRVFEHFTRQCISHPFKTSFDETSTWDIYDLAFTGSDQVWHKWSENSNELSYFYLNRITPEKRIAYAPSFGFSEFPKADLKQHKQGIEGMKQLSCREPKGQELIKKLTGRDSEVVPDPTMLLKKDEWKEVERSPRITPREKYILCYFLGDKTKEYSAEIRKYAEKENCRIINIASINNLDYFYTDPSEFLWLLDHANAVYTDSFHACVFSIIFHKPFMVFKRQQEGFEDMFDRIKTLLSNCGLEKCEYLVNERIYIPEWKDVDDKMEISRKIGINYIKKTLSSE